LGVSVQLPDGYCPHPSNLNPIAWDDAETYYIFYYSKLFTELWSVSKLLSRLEAAIGIEPMNKGFTVRVGPLSLSVMECHRPVFIDRFGEPCYSVTLKIAPDPTKVPTVNFTIFLRRFRRGDSFDAFVFLASSVVRIPEILL
jgi:hypothetical protein